MKEEAIKTEKENLNDISNQVEPHKQHLELMEMNKQMDSRENT